MINLRGSELPGLPGLEYCPRSALVGISHRCDIPWVLEELERPIVPDTKPIAWDIPDGLSHVT
jgi:hypothetical protein